MKKTKTDPDAPPDSLTSLVSSLDDFEQDIIRLKAIEQAAIEYVNLGNTFHSSANCTDHIIQMKLAYQNLKELLPNE